MRHDHTTDHQDLRLLFEQVILADALQPIIQPSNHRLKVSIEGGRHSLVLAVCNLRAQSFDGPKKKRDAFEILLKTRTRAQTRVDSRMNELGATGHVMAWSATQRSRSRAPESWSLQAVARRARRMMVRRQVWVAVAQRAVVHLRLAERRSDLCR
jgi:hypothetical protein